jgi:hypothetical protein
MNHKQLLERIRMAALQLGGDGEYEVTVNAPEDVEPYDQLKVVDVYPDTDENTVYIDLG